MDIDHYIHSDRHTHYILCRLQIVGIARYDKDLRLCWKKKKVDILVELSLKEFQFNHRAGSFLQGPKSKTYLQQQHRLQ